MFDLQLSQHFMLSDFLKSRVAQELGINNYPTLTIISNLQQVCLHVLEPIISHFGATIHVKSGYQCPEITHELGIPANSQHTTGEAIDFVVVLPGTRDQLDSLLQVFSWMCDHSPFDELYVECIKLPEKKIRRISRLNIKPESRYHFWIHVSYRQDRNKNRRQRQCLVER